MASILNINQGGTQVSQFGEFDDGNSGTSKTIDWSVATAGIAHKITVTGACTFTFTPPLHPRWVQLKLVHEASATVYALTWPGTVKWPGGTKIANTNTSGAVDIASFWYDGTNYYGVGSLNFS